MSVVVDYVCYDLLSLESDKQEITGRQARAYYQEFLQVKDKIVGALEEFYFTETGKSLDYSGQSLLGLWEWYLDNVEVVAKTKAQLRTDIMNCYAFDVMKITTEIIQNPWEYIGRDISIYFGECLVRSDSCLQWGTQTKAKTHRGYKEPAIYGPVKGTDPYYTLGLHPHLRRVVTGGVDKNDLYEEYLLKMDRLATEKTQAGL